MQGFRHCHPSALAEGHSRDTKNERGDRISLRNTLLALNGDDWFARLVPDTCAEVVVAMFIEGIATDPVASVEELYDKDDGLHGYHLRLSYCVSNNKMQAGWLYYAGYELPLTADAPAEKLLMIPYDS